MKKNIEFKFNGKYRYISVEKLTYDNGKKFYNIDYYNLDDMSQTRVKSENKGEIVAMNFLTTGLIEILFKQHKSVGQLTFLLTNLLDKALKVPLDRLEQAFHGVSSNCYPEQLKIIVDKLKAETFKSKQHLRIFIVENIVELWD
tara:strand:+ start:610 stop:1041 length:432 start_codon:yes stop_codon:yes gene_type:complete